MELIQAYLDQRPENILAREIQEYLDSVISFELSIALNQEQEEELDDNNEAWGVTAPLTTKERSKSHKAYSTSQYLGRPP